MGYRFTKEEIKDKNIVDARQFDNAVGTYVDVLNGGLDRDNIPTNSINDGMLTDNVFCKMFFLNDQFVDDADQEIDGNTNAISTNRPECQLGGLQYGRSPIFDGGFWIEACSTVMDTEEGMLEVSWKCTEVKGQYWAYYKNHTTARVA
jgi:hypothetical protein